MPCKKRTSSSPGALAAALIALLEESLQPFNGRRPSPTMGDALFRKKFDTPEEINGRYTLIKRVGKGSYGVVYEALDTETNDKVSALGDPGEAARAEGAGLGGPRPPPPARRSRLGAAPKPQALRRISGDVGWLFPLRLPRVMLAGLGTEGAVPRAGGGGRGAGWTAPKPGGSGPG